MRKMREATNSELMAMRIAIDDAIKASREKGKSGIGAVVLRGGEIVSRGVNCVHLQDDPTRHAEIVALGRAARTLGRPDLAGCTLVSTLQPCEMCLAAARFAGIERIIFGAQKKNVAGKYFAFNHMNIEDFVGYPPSFCFVAGVLEHDVLGLYEDGEE